MAGRPSAELAEAVMSSGLSFRPCGRGGKLWQEDFDGLSRNQLPLR